ncbi:UDP-2,3-diacylglucosamine diphosphatase [Sphingomonas sp. MMS24-JH45]
MGRRADGVPAADARYRAEPGSSWGRKSPSPASSAPARLDRGARRGGGRDYAAPRTRYRTIFVSDGAHLGTAGCNAELLLDFLKRHECETLYLVGDIVDGWQLRKGWYWPQAHNDVVRAVLKMAKHGTRVVYLPGNHDEHFRSRHRLEGRAASSSPTSRSTSTSTSAWIAAAPLRHRRPSSPQRRRSPRARLPGDGDQFPLKSNRWVNRGRRLLGLPYWSLAAHMKRRVKNAVAFISRFEEVVAHAAAERGVDGVVCGHIHSAEIRQFGPDTATSPITTTATGWRAAPRWSRTPTVRCGSSTGRNGCATNARAPARARRWSRCPKPRGDGSIPDAFRLKSRRVRGGARSRLSASPTCARRSSPSARAENFFRYLPIFVAAARDRRQPPSYSRLAVRRQPFAARAAGG